VDEITRSCEEVKEVLNSDITKVGVKADVKVRHPRAFVDFYALFGSEGLLVLDVVSSYTRNDKYLSRLEENTLGLAKKFCVSKVFYGCITYSGRVVLISSSTNSLLAKLETRKRLATKRSDRFLISFHREFFEYVFTMSSELFPGAQISYGVSHRIGCLSTKSFRTRDVCDLILRLGSRVKDEFVAEITRVEFCVTRNVEESGTFSSLNLVYGKGDCLLVVRVVPYAGNNMLRGLARRMSDYTQLTMSVLDVQYAYTYIIEYPANNSYELGVVRVYPKNDRDDEVQYEYVD
jgi:hypothetical protein